jgi:prepilin-type processing-associated H-X9-DG protein
MFGSAHPVGMNVALCDGSVRFVRYEIPIDRILLPLVVRNDGQSFSAGTL